LPWRPRLSCCSPSPVSAIDPDAMTETRQICLMEDLGGR
jgi:hypothetical protein